MMSYNVVPIEELVRAFVDSKMESSRAYERGADLVGEKLTLETGKIGEAIVARGDVGATALRSLLQDPREEVQFIAAAWLSELDPIGAASTLERLQREGSNFQIRGFAELKLQNNRDRGLLPTR